MHLTKLHNKFSKALIITSLALLCAMFPAQPTLAVTAGDWRAGNITDDIVFHNNFSMTAEQIQQFLNAKVPVCDNWGTQPYAGTTRRAYSEARGIKFPLTCLKDYHENTNTKENNLEGRGIPAGAKSAAQIISEVSHQFRINPQVLIVLLQKEQALTMDEWPWPNQFRSAMGYGCPDTASCDSQYYGFYNQAYNAARQFRLYANNPNGYNHIPGQNNQVRYNPQISCGTSTVFIENVATASLYNYTPYQPNQAALNNLNGMGDSCSSYGNRNYWRMFNDWFGSTKTSTKWLRQSTANGQVWLVVEGSAADGSYQRKKWRLTTPEIYEAYGLQYEPVALVSEEYLSQFADNGTLSTIGSSKSYPHFQLVDSYRRYYVPGIEYCAFNGDGSPNTTTSWGIDCFNTNKISVFPGNEFLERVPGHGGLKPLLTTRDNITYRLEGGKKLPIYDAQTFQDLGYNWGTSTTVMQNINAQQPLGPLQISHAAVLSFGGGPFLVYDNKTFKFHNAGNLATFGAWGLHKIVKQPPPSSYDSSPPTVFEPLSVWASDNAGRKYIIDDGRKIDVTGAASDMPSVTWQTTAQDVLDRLPTAGYGNYAWERQTGGVYKIEAGKKRLVPNWENFAGLGIHFAQLLPLNNTTLAQIPDGDKLLAQGGLFQTSTGVHIVNGSGSLHVPSWPFFRHFGVNPGTIVQGPETLNTAYPTAGELSTVVQTADGWRYVVSNGVRYVVGESMRAEWGIPTNTFKPIDAGNLNRLRLAGEFGRFFIHNGGIYYASGGQKHHVQSWNAYLALGAGQLTEVESDLFNAIPSGSPIP